MKKIGFSGTLDPITNGHMWVIAEARAMAESVVVFLSENTAKKAQFSAEERKKIIELSTAERGWHNVQVLIVRGEYTARAAKKAGVDYLIRGIRNTTDFDYENLIQQTNVDVLHGAKTIFVMPPRDLGSVSSSFVRALQGPVGWHWQMRKFVPPPAYEAWIIDWLRSEWAQLWRYPDADAAALANAERWFAHLIGPSCYGSGTRHYHNLNHLVHGLTEIRAWAANTCVAAQDVDIVKKAFWFHDAVYRYDEHGAPSNEEASALLWLGSELDADTVGVADLIRATDHFQGDSVTHALKHVLLGVDLAILGQDEDIYDAYAGGIRAEYGHVPDLAYRRQRGQALQHLRGKAAELKLYGDAYFSEQYNEKAMTNMLREIERLA